jgi:hypothetical protein
MKIMSRDFTRAEKLLLLVLVVILLGLGYYYFVDQPVRSTIANYEAETASLQSELDVYEAQLTHLRQVQNSMDQLQKEGNLSWMGSYNNSEAEVRFLNDILATTLQYSIAFADVTRSGNQIRRSFTLQYRTRDYQEAQDIMSRLLTGRNRCLIGDVNCSIADDGTVTMRQFATFYETMVGGTPDAGLPRDTAVANS